ncbi:hypothetical protein BY996DRAFT_6425402 [Phakopsora pachyrhizi]|nr:hypothetical protein BY996DRAFT_6425402 [Phakopsora pachyrhizi]
MPSLQHLSTLHSKPKNLTDGTFCFLQFVHAQIKLYEFICAHASLWATLNLKVSLHAALVQLQVVLEAYVTLLFQYISADLDLSANLRVLLSASLQRAIDACAS